MFEPPVPSQAAAAWSLLLEVLDRRAAAERVAEHGDVIAALAEVRSGPARLVRVRAQIARRQDAFVGEGVGLVAEGEAGFPERLRCIPDPPRLLHYRGDPTLLTGTAIAIVGARRASRHGLGLAASLAAALAGSGAVIVSGLALGVDSAAHRGALDAEGSTVAVLGSGVNRIQPVSNTPLARRVLDAGGLLMSEYPLGTPAAPFRFPERNRLISGLSLGVVVVEASERSGSLITARFAGEQGREVMAVPGTPGMPNTAGSNRLLKQGAALIESAEDVLAAIASDLPGGSAPAGRGPVPGPRTPEHAAVLDRLDGHAQSLDSLVEHTGLDAGTCAVVLTELELDGFVQRLTDGYIRRPSRY